MKFEDFKKVFLNKQFDGDCFVFDYIDNNYRLIENIEKKKEIEEILPILYRTQYIYLDYIDGVKNKKLDSILFNYNIEDFYIDLKTELFNILEITDEELEKIYY